MEQFLYKFIPEQHTPETDDSKQQGINKYSITNYYKLNVMYFILIIYFLRNEKLNFLILGRIFILPCKKVMKKVKRLKCRILNRQAFWSKEIMSSH